MDCFRFRLSSVIFIFSLATTHIASGCISTTTSVASAYCTAPQCCARPPCLTNGVSNDGGAFVAPAQPSGTFVAPAQSSASADGAPTSAGGDLRTYLGGDISAKIYNTGATGDFIKQAADLYCDGLSKCLWRNVGEGDALDWATGIGKPNPDRLLLVTGLSTTPEPSFLVLASNPRDATDAGLLVSDPIGCQLNDGELSFRLWRSLADGDHGPDLEICRRFTADKIIRDCNAVTPDVDLTGPITTFIPRSDQPFEIVFRGFGFESSPAGGLIFLDDITYDADVLDQAGCQGNSITLPPQPPAAAAGAAGAPDYESIPPLGTDYVDLSSNSVTDNVLPVTPVPVTPDSVTTKTSSGTFDNVSCTLLKCGFKLTESTCNYFPTGKGARGPGSTYGWTVTSGNSNTANPLTGIRVGPGGDRAATFAVADFSDPRQSVVDPATKYVLESQDLEFTQGAEPFIGFDRYIAVEGVVLKWCTDADGSDCFWSSAPLKRGSSAADNRQWIREITRLPVGTRKVFALSHYDNTRNFNAGQVGLSNVGVYEDAEGETPSC